MKYALVLESEISRTTWNCYNIADTVQGLVSLNCFSSEVLKLPKSQYAGEVVQSGLKKENCSTRNKSIFCIVKFPNFQLSNKFNLL